MTLSLIFKRASLVKYFVWQLANIANKQAYALLVFFRNSYFPLLYNAAAEALLA